MLSKVGTIYVLDESSHRGTGRTSQAIPRSPNDPRFTPPGFVVNMNQWNIHPGLAGL